MTLILGSKSNNKNLLFKAINLYKEKWPIERVATRGREGIETLALEWAYKNGVPTKVFYEHIDNRDEKMVNAAKGAILIWDEIEISLFEKILLREIPIVCFLKENLILTG